MDVLDHLILPVTAMTLMLLGQYFLIMRSSMVDVLTEDFVTVKRATGLPWHRVVRGHAVPERAAAAGDAVGDPVRSGGRRRDHDRDDLLLAGAGRAELPGDQDKDFPVLQGTFLVFSFGVILANLLADCLYFYLDPRVQSR